MVHRARATRDRYRGRTIVNDRYCKGFFPKGHVLTVMSLAIFTGFQKEFHEGPGGYTGIASDTHGRIRAGTSLECVTLDEPQGSLQAGDGHPLCYLDDPWRGFYDIYRVIDEELLIGRVYLLLPHWAAHLWFPDDAQDGFAQTTVDDDRAPWETASVPDVPEPKAPGAWTWFQIALTGQRGLSGFRPQAGRVARSPPSAHGVDGRTGDPELHRNHSSSMTSRHSMPTSSASRTTSWSESIWPNSIRACASSDRVAGNLPPASPIQLLIRFMLYAHAVREGWANR